MNEHVKYFGISAGLHGAVLALMIALTAGAVSHKDVVTIDFSLNNAPSLCEPQQTNRTVSTIPFSLPAKSASVGQTAALPVPPPVPTVNSPAAIVEAAVQPAKDVVPSAVASASQHAGGVTAATETNSANNYARTAETAPTSTISTGENNIEQVKKKYFKEHFNYIRDLIIKRLEYPPVARRMEWSGKVVLAFVVSEDGGVHSVRVKESSGYAVLDNSAMDTVKRVAPFPRPPVAAEIVMPVHFRLQ